MGTNFTLDQARAGWKTFAPNIVSALLCMAIILRIGLAALSMSRTPVETETHRQLPRAVPSARNGLDVGSIVQAHLFGVAAADGSVADAPVSQEDLTLTATFAKADPGQGFAIIRDTAPAGRVYATGQAITGGAVLAQVYADSVILSRNGAFEKLPLRTRIWTVEAAGGTVRTAQVANLEHKDTPTAPTDENSNTPVKMNGFLLMPVLGDRNAGARIGMATKPDVLTKAGLRTGDIITAINGEPVHGMRAAANLLSAAAGGALTVTIKRGADSEDVAVQSLD